MNVLIFNGNFLSRILFSRSDSNRKNKWKYSKINENIAQRTTAYRQVSLYTLGDTNSDDEDDTSGICNREIVGQDNVKRTKKLREKDKKA